MRGSGTAGLAAMQEVSGDIIRPLLYVSRRRIEEYCRKHGLEYVTDNTNLEPDCTRNILRLEVLPMLEKINPDAVKCIVRTSLLAKKRRGISACAGRGVRRDNHDGAGRQRYYRRKGAFAASARAGGAGAALGMERADSTVDFELHHVKACLELCRGQSGRRLSLARGVTALYSGGSLLLIPPEKKRRHAKRKKRRKKGAAALNGKGKGAVSPAEEGAELPFREGSFFLKIPRYGYRPQAAQIRQTAGRGANISFCPIPPE